MTKMIWMMMLLLTSSGLIRRHKDKLIKILFIMIRCQINKFPRVLAYLKMWIEFIFCQISFYFYYSNFNIKYLLGSDRIQWKNVNIRNDACSTYYPFDLLLRIIGGNAVFLVCFYGSSLCLSLIVLRFHVLILIALKVSTKIYSLVVTELTSTILDEFLNLCVKLFILSSSHKMIFGNLSILEGARI